MTYILSLTAAYLDGIATVVVPRSTLDWDAEILETVRES